MQVSNQIKRLMLALLLPVACASAVASGRDSHEDPKEKLYHSGKAVYEQKLACPKCAMAGKTLDQNMAKMIINDAEKTAALSADEKTALFEYLKKRYQL